MKIRLKFSASRTQDWTYDDSESMYYFTVIPTIQIYWWFGKYKERVLVGEITHSRHFEETGKYINKLWLPLCFRFLLWELMVAFEVEIKTKK